MKLSRIYQAFASLMAKQIRGLSIIKVKKDLNKLKLFSKRLKLFKFQIDLKSFSHY